MQNRVSAFSPPQIQNRQPNYARHQDHRYQPGPPRFPFSLHQQLAEPLLLLRQSSLDNQSLVLLRRMDLLAFNTVDFFLGRGWVTMVLSRTVGKRFSS